MTQFSETAACCVVAIAVLTTAFVTCQTYQSSPVPDRAPQQLPPAATRTGDLLNRPRTEAVCRELLHRSEVSPETLQAALIRIATLRNTAPEDVLLEAIRSATSHDRHLARNLCIAAEAITPDDSFRIRLQRVVLDSSDSSVRKCALAVLVSTDRSARSAFAITEDQPERRHEVLEVLPIVPSPVTRSTFYNQLQSMVRDSQSPESKSDQSLRIAAIEVALKLPGRELRKARDLIQLGKDRALRPAALRGLRNIDANYWSPDDIGHMGALVIVTIAELPPEDRRSPATDDALAIARKLLQLYSVDKRQPFESRVNALMSSSDWQLSPSGASLQARR